ncbi:hypothetical protein ACGFIU_25745 [Rhodococcus oryzae]|uniref:hypothetical protein n=1 Tax=Rhodococcus oryzae TaxID=2571143 RepID=UPI0037230A7C
MSNNMMRRGASILAAAAVVAGGLTVGAGTASASCIASGGLERLQSITEPLGVESIGRYCSWFTEHLSRSIENVDVVQGYKPGATAGDLMSYTYSFSLSNDPARNLTKLVSNGPPGYAMTGVVVDLVEWINGVPKRTPIEVGQVGQDPTTGTVTITPPGEGWPIPRRTDTSRPELEVRVTYRVPLNVRPGFVTAGVTFEATGLTGTQGWSQLGSTEIDNPYGDAFGSSGS